MRVEQSFRLHQLMLSITALVIALFVTACATTDGPTQQLGSESDLAGAHLDKRKFLLGVSMLGQSVEKDIEILRKITEHTFEPRKEKQDLLINGWKRMTSVTSLS